MPDRGGKITFSSTLEEEDALCKPGEEKIIALWKLFKNEGNKDRDEVSKIGGSVAEAAADVVKE